MNNENQHSCRDRQIRVNNVSKRLGIPERTVRHLAATRRLPGYKVGEKIWFFKVSDIDAYQANHEGLR